MTLQEFQNKYLGKHVEVAGSANAINQCTDFANAYIREVLHYDIIEWTNAVDFPKKAGDRYEWIPNTPTGTPKAGDIVIFKKYGNLYGEPGHIGVIVSADVNKMQVLEQNYPTGSVVKIGTHNYLGCTGWLRAKEVISTDTKLQECELHKSNLQNQVNGLLKDLELLKGQLSDAETKIGTASGRIQELITQNSDLSSKLGDANGQIALALKELDEKNQALLRELNSQHDFADQASKSDEARLKITKTLDDLIWEIEDQLKLSHKSDDAETKISLILGSLQKQLEAKVIEKDINSYKTIIKIGGKLCLKF